MPTFKEGRRRIGYCLSEKKKRKLNFHLFEELCRKRGFEVSEIDLGKTLSSHGPFDIIIHKLSDLIVESGYDVQSHHLIQSFQAYLETQPRTILLDPLPAMRTLSDRFQSYRLLQSLQSLCRENCIFSPPYIEVMTSDRSKILRHIREQHLTFPFICKPRVAHGCSSHQMALIFNQHGLGDVKPPCLLQSFINHSAILYKVFVVGSAQFVVQRPSLKNLPPGESERKTIFFNSHDVSKPESCSHLSTTNSGEGTAGPPASDIVQQIVQGLSSALGISLFGVDLIVDMQSGHCAVIDVNAFPGYEGVPEFFPALIKHIEMLMESQEQTSSTQALPAEHSSHPRNPHQEKAKENAPDRAHLICPTPPVQDPWIGKPRTTENIKASEPDTFYSFAVSPSLLLPN
ncbi:inositol-tetrakisphosphate 1-kinase isoform X2 [Microcaecilia unicolor]|uniref:Inositol-tetrakisphosphate 1-kinase n=1 Tax=Microcaecilia unicolor TaxID=1415580 RepID=A0A6P7ZIG2_9AMPH|nr:inositol-tetrakisphosphate 1-kinase-like isoform X2 [Microcaecilia unicolor]